MVKGGKVRLHDFQAKRSMTIKVAINGFGRIGSNILRAFYEDRTKHDLQFVAINDLGDAKTNAHLSSNDTAHGRFQGTVSVEGDSLAAKAAGIRVGWPNAIPPSCLEGAGRGHRARVHGPLYEQGEGGRASAGGAKKVIISAPGDKDVDRTVGYGVNHRR